jgi:putative ABC transport system ATP-binding protein
MGRIVIDGRDISQLTEREIAPVRRTMGMLFQNGALFDSMNVGDNVAFPLRERGEKDQAVVAAKVQEALEMVDLSDRMDHFPSQLSGGEQQRVAIARAIAKKPEVLLCDEPTGALDITTGITVLEAVERINRDLGTLTVIITHNASMAQMADRVLHLSDGQIVKQKRNDVRLPVRELEW